MCASSVAQLRAGQARARRPPARRTRPWSGSTSSLRSSPVLATRSATSRACTLTIAARVRAGDAEHLVLVPVVVQHQLGDLVGHLGQQPRCGSGRSSSPASTSRSSRILMLTSWSEQSTPAELSIASVLIFPPRARELDPAALGQPQVAALADDLDPQVAAVGPDRVVGLVAGVGVRLGGRLDVGADAAVPQQVGRRAQDRRDQLRRAQRVTSSASPSAARISGADRHRLRGARPHPAARR